nr:ATP-binding protein [Lacticaseibacillus saniviri]
MQIEALMQTYQLNQAPLLVAVSGGVDSMVLLTLLAHSRYHDQLHVAHFNHHLRAVSDQEAIHVQVYAAQLGVPITIGEWQTPDSSEAKAREARYRFCDKPVIQSGRKR